MKIVGAMWLIVAMLVAGVLLTVANASDATTRILGEGVVVVGVAMAVLVIAIHGLDRE